MAAQTFAFGNLLKLGEGYAGQRSAWSPDTITPTRLGDPVTVFRLGRWDGSAIMPYFGDAPSQRNWALSEVSVSQSKAVGVLKPDGTTSRAICSAKERWPKWEQDMPLLILTAVSSGWIGTVTKDNTTPIKIQYDERSGFRLM